MKTALPWLLVILLLAAGGWLYTSDRQRDAQMEQLQEKLDAASRTSDNAKAAPAPDKSATPSTSGNEELLRLRNEVTRLQAENRRLAAQPGAARGQSAQGGPGQGGPAQPTQFSHEQQLEFADDCGRNLLLIQQAKQQFLTNSTIKGKYYPGENDLMQYLPDAIFPTCPGGGRYTIGSMTDVPGCSIPEHVYPRK